MKDPRFRLKTRETVKKTLECSFETESQGKSEGGKAPPSRSIKQFFKLDKFEKLDGQRGEKTFSTRCRVFA